MAKEWILNQAMNRFQLNFKRNVGAVSELIRKCSPKTLEDWESYYFEHGYSKEHLEELGQKLYVKITEVIQLEVSEVTLEECIIYIRDVVINRTFQGYQTEIQTIYGQLEHLISRKIEPAPDEWDRGYNIDFFIAIEGHSIGLQVKPVTYEHFNEDYRWRVMQSESHERFEKKFGGKVFTIFSASIDGKKKIVNEAVIPEIIAEVQRLETK